MQSRMFSPARRAADDGAFPVRGGIGAVLTWAAHAGVQLPEPRSKADVARGALRVAADVIGPDDPAFRHCAARICSDLVADVTGEECGVLDAWRLCGLYPSLLVVAALEVALSRPMDAAAVWRYAAAVLRGWARERAR